MEVERYLLASALSGIVSQKLARKLCDKCKKIRPTTPFEKQYFKELVGADVNQVYTAVGCPECSGGYKGRIAIQEVLLISPEIRDAINASLKKAQLRDLVYNGEVITLIQDGLYKVMAGFTSLEEIMKLVEADDELNAKTCLRNKLRLINQVSSTNENIQMNNQNQ